MHTEAKISPVVKTLSRKVTQEELNQVSGGWFNQGTYVTVGEQAEQENSFDSKGVSVGLDTIR
ncbi:MAG: hypothetical protein WC736_16400 [Gallionella sp.]|jgi:hypothetical protein